jgi:hypothetical protein
VAEPRISPPLDPTSLHDRIVHSQLGGYCFFHSLNSTNVVLGLIQLQRSGGLVPDRGQEEESNRQRDGRQGWQITNARPVLGVVSVGKEPKTDRPIFESRREPTHCVTLVNLLDTRTGIEERAVMDVGFGRKGPIGLVPLPSSEKAGAAGEVIWDDSLRGEAWRVRRPKVGELPDPEEGLDERWLQGHPLTDGEWKRNYLMQHRLFALGQDPSESDQDDENDDDDDDDDDDDGYGAWETLYAFSVAEHHGLETFQTLSGHVFDGSEGCTTKFKDHLTVSRTYDLEQGIDFPDKRNMGKESGSEARTRSMGRLALTDMVLSTFATTDEGKGKKEVIKEYKDERERNEDLERLFGLKL